jgi:DNA mismatch repair ATPase MutS
MQRINPDYMRLLRPHLKAGTCVLTQGARHPALERSDGNKLFFAPNTGDPRAILNFKAQLRRFVGGV